MKQKQIITFSYFLAFIVIAALLIKMNISLTSMLGSAASFDTVIDSFNLLQKKLATSNIIGYFILLVIGFWAFIRVKKVNYIFLSLLLFISVTLYNSVNLNKALFALKGLDPLKETGYWIMVFLGVFYIIGAVVIASIGYIAIKNYAKRNARTNQ